jgi:hypothetical protein
MPKVIDVRERLIRMLISGEPLSLTRIRKSFDKSRRVICEQELSNLISEGVLLKTGTGRRGYPYMIQLSPVYPISVKCPLCRQETRHRPGVFEHEPEGWTDALTPKTTN